MLDLCCVYCLVIFHWVHDVFLLLIIWISRVEVQLLREINLDKLRAWKPFYRAGKQRGLGLQLPLHRNPGDKRSSFGQLNSIEIITSGFEVYADGPTRVLRICEFADSHKANTSLYSSAKMQLRVFDSAVSILELSKKVFSSLYFVHTWETWETIFNY